MRIKQEKKINYYVVKLCYKSFFFYKARRNKILCAPFSHKYLLQLSKVRFYKKKMIYIQNDAPLKYSYSKYLCSHDFFFLKKRFNRRLFTERRITGYYGLRTVGHVRQIYYFFHKYVYWHYKFFYNSFYFKQHLYKNYNIFKNRHYTTFFWKFSYPYDNTYFFDSYELSNVPKLVKYEFFNFLNCTLDEYTEFTYPIEFFFFKKCIYNKYNSNNFFIKDAIIFLNNNVPHSIGDTEVLNSLMFYETKTVSLNNIADYSVETFLPLLYTNNFFYSYQFYYYRVLQLLFL